MKIARVLALLLALAGAAAAVWFATRPPSGSERAPGAAPGDTAAPPTFEVEPGGSAGGGESPAPKAPDTPAAPDPGAPTLPTSLAAPGTPVRDGQSVDLRVGWKRGERNRARYEIQDFQVAADREHGHRTPWITTWRALLEVVEGDGSGAGRLRVTVESIRLQGFRPDGIPFDVDSRAGDTDDLGDPAFARMVQPLLAVIGRPLDFRFGAAGALLDVDGADEWRERFLTEVQRIQKGAVNDAPDAPTRESIADRWTEYLFPRLGGGTLAGGERRTWTRTEPYLAPWAVEWKGAVTAIADDADAFAARIEAVPNAVETGGRAGSDFAASIQAVRAIPIGHGYRAEYRFARDPAALVEAVIHAKYQIWVARRGGGAPGQAGPRPTFTEIERRVSIRRTSED